MRHAKAAAILLSVLTSMGLVLPAVCSNSVDTPNARKYKPSPPLEFTGKTNVVISGLRITNSAGPGITIRGCSNVQVINCSIGPCTGVGVNIQGSSNVLVSSNRFEKVASGVYALTSRKIVVTHNRCLNVVGPMPRGQLAQFDKVNGPGNCISSNVCQNIAGQSNPEDAINLYMSNGTADDPIQVVGNRIRGGGPSGSGGGIMTGDAGGSYVLVKDNVLVDPGQYGIAIAGGDHIRVINNKVFGKRQPFTNVGLYVWNQYSPPCHDHVVKGNKVRWTNREGAENPCWNASNCGSVEGWDENDWHAALDETLLPEKLVEDENEPKDISRDELDRWSAPYRKWHYWPDHVIAAEPRIPGHEDFKNTDVPCVYQLPGQTSVWYMSFIGFNGKGYNSFVAESTNLVDWSQPQLAMGFGKSGEFDFGGCVIGAFLYESYDIKAPRVLKKRDGKFWTLYGCYAKQGGYELDPGYEGLASSENGLTWKRAYDKYILSVHDADVGDWEKDCIYQPWLVEHDGRFYNFYNAKKMPAWIEQLGVATSEDLRTWKRDAGNPVLRVRLGGYDERFCSDAKVFRDGDHWVAFYFGVNKDGAHIMMAFSRDLLHWTADPEPLYKAGGHPGGLDKSFAHKISLVYNPANDTFYLYYCAAGNKGRGIGLITSKPLTGPTAGKAR